MVTDPLSRLDGLLWLHASLMLLLSFIAFPLTLLLAKLHSSGHPYFAAMSFVGLCVGLAAAFSSHHTHDGDTHETMHNSFHKMGGTMVLCLTVMQVAVGYGKRFVEHDINIFREMHQWLGLILVVFLFPWQSISGIATLFEVCADDLSGRDQCVGHFGPAFAMWLMALAYLRVTKAPAKDLPYRESTLVAATGIFIILYSLATEYPYTAMNGRHHLAAGVIMAAVGIVATRQYREPVPEWLDRGVPVLVVCFCVFAIFQMHAQINEFGKLQHTLFSYCVLAAGIFRVVHHTGFTSLSLLAATIFFITSQKGFAILWHEVYSHQASQTAVVMVQVILIAFIAFFVKKITFV